MKKLAAVLLCALWATGASAEQPSSVVKVLVEDGHGSGVHIGNGLVLTAAHVVQVDKTPKVPAHPATTADLKTQDGVLVKASVLWSSTEYDTALLYAPALNVATSPLACRSLAIGEPIHAVGNPLSVEFAHTWGRVSALRTETSVVVNITFLPGMSGGPVFDEAGNVVGIVKSTFGQSALGFTTPMSAICRLLART